jgi:hypothetical protein
MRKIAFAFILASLTFGNSAFARNEGVFVPLDETVKFGIDQGQLDGSAKFYLSGSRTPPVESRLGDDVSKKKTNAVGKNDATACKWVALSALMAFEAKAKSLGANAVVDIQSHNKKVAYKDPVKFECRAGSVMGGVAFKGMYAKTR